MDLYIGLGSNIEPRDVYIRRAINLLSSVIGPLVRASKIIETDPVDMASEQKFLNAVAVYDTRLHPEEVLRKTKMLEKSLGRTRKSEKGKHFDRTIDIDILQYGNLRIDSPDLVIPHPRMLERAFVLGPLAEIAPDAESVARPGYTFARLNQMLLLRESFDSPGAEADREITISEAFRDEDGQYPRLCELLNQLTDRPFEKSDYERLIAAPHSHLYLIRIRDGRQTAVAGMLTLCIGATTAGPKGWIEDVVVDQSYRGMGLGRRLLRFVIDRARTMRLESLILTSAPHRLAANRLYRSVGFELRDTNSYRLKL